MNGSPGEYGRSLPTPLSATALKNVTPVKRIGAVSPAARLTTRIIPVRMPESELGNTIVRMVCQRDAPRFQQASRKDIGTAPSASRVLVITTDRFITAIVSEAVSNPPCRLMPVAL